MQPRSRTSRVASLFFAVAVAGPLLPPDHAARAQEPTSSSKTPVAQTAPDDVKALERRLEADERKLRELEHKQRVQQRNVPEPTAAAQWGPKGLSIASADGSNVLRLGALVQADGRYFADDGAPSTANTWLLRRVRPILQGTLDDIYDFKLMPDFGGGKAIVQDAFVSARFRPWLVLTVGKFKPAVGLE